MGILIPEYTFDSVGIQVSNVYASTYRSEISITNEKVRGIWLTFTYFIWASLDARQADKSFIGSVRKRVQYDDTIPIMTQVYNSIKQDYPDASDVQ
jgi:hypothetical protein